MSRELSLEQNESVYPELSSHIENDKVKEMLDMESNEPKKIPYPKRVFFIIGNEFCERFNFYGMKSEFVRGLKFTVLQIFSIFFFTQLFSRYI